VFHIELRQFPHVSRAFNLTRDELDQRFIRPWVAGSPVEFDDRRWSREKARLTIYEAPELPPEEMGMGRGWGNITRTGQDVTAGLLNEAEGTAAALAAELERFKDEVVERCAVEPCSLHSLLLLANQRHPGWRVSDRLALTERTVWELLHQERVTMSHGEPVPRELWESKVLDWESWAGDQVTLSTVGEPAGGEPAGG
jgi:hypothetical protein